MVIQCCSIKFTSCGLIQKIHLLLPVMIQSPICHLQCNPYFDNVQKCLNASEAQLCVQCFELVAESNFLMISMSIYILIFNLTNAAIEIIMFSSYLLSFCSNEIYHCYTPTLIRCYRSYCSDHTELFKEDVILFPVFLLNN